MLDVPPPPPARARSSDHDTSHEAASVADASVSRVQELILAVLTRPCTDEDIIRRVRHYFPECKATEQSVRSRRAELVRLRKVEWDGTYGTTQANGRTRRWRLA